MARACVSLLSVFLSALVFVKGGRRFSINETPERIISNGYPAERHYATTEDGYILEMHRIPSGRNESEHAQKPVVFLMPGLLSASVVFITTGPDTAIAYNLADAGFDVWMGNARGTRNSRNHTSLNPDDDDEFFNFSFEEIGTFDIPTMVDYALNTTGQKQLHFIGHSQGSTAFLVMTSVRPEYNDKFKSAHLLAPVGYQTHFPQRTIQDLARGTDRIFAIALALGRVEVYPPSRDAKENRFAFCGGDNRNEDLCSVFKAIDQYVRRQKDPSSVNDAAGASMRQFAHFGQNIRDKAFRRFDFGILANLRKYRQRKPPIYNLSRITTNVTLHYSLGDSLVDERDSLMMASDMPNAKVRKVSREDFQHDDFTDSEDSRELVTDYIIGALLSMEKEKQIQDRSDI